MVEQDGLYEKYRVFHEPEEADNHPVQVPHAFYYDGPDDHEGGVLEEAEGFLFVLKPDTDYHARVAIAAYAESVQAEKPRLAEDLRLVLEQLRDEDEATVVTVNEVVRGSATFAEALKAIYASEVERKGE